MSDEQVKYKFYLDAKDGVAQLDEIHKKIAGLGDAKNLSGLIQGFTTLAGPIFIAGAALLTVKKALDFTMEGESIIRVNKTFEALTEQAGISSTVIESGLKKSMKGLIDMDDALKSANKAIIQLGGNAAKIPEIMDLARRSGKIFGVETLDAFEAISTTIATGSVRQLRQLGIVIDANKAYREYAKSIGVTTSQLSEQGRQTALMNAILEKGNSKFKETGTSAETLTKNSKQLGVALKEIGDTLAVLAAKQMGGFFAGVTKDITGVAVSLNNSLKASFGTTTEKAEAELSILENDVVSFRKELEKLKTVGSEDSNSFTVVQNALDKAEARIATLKELAEQAEIDSIKTAPAGPKTTNADGTDANVDNEKKLLADAQFQRELLVLSEARIKSQQAVETDALAFRQSLGEQEVILVDQYNARIAEIRAKGDRGDEMTKQQASTLILQIEEEKKNKIIEFEREKEQAVLQVYENQVKAAQSSSEGIIAGFKQQGMIAKKESQDYGKQGVQTFDSVNSGAKKFFVGLGEGSKDAGQLMKEFLFGALADYAEQQGQVLLATGIGTGNGIAIAQGGALLALSGLIRSLAGGGGGGSGGGSSGAAAGGTANVGNLEKPQLEQGEKKSVTIQVQGNYFETEQTKTRLTEMIRESSDATDYKFQQIGVK